MAKLSIIVAFDQQRGIGVNNTLPWHLSEDLLRFKTITTGHAIIMGRKTFESIGRPLPNRRNIVLTRNVAWQQEGVEVVNSLSAAIKLLNHDPAFIIGGADLYAQALPLCDELLVTEIHRTFDCDAFFPMIDQKFWKEIERSTHFSEKNQFEYAFVKLLRLP